MTPQKKDTVSKNHIVNEKAPHRLNRKKIPSLKKVNTHGPIACKRNATEDDLHPDSACDKTPRRSSNSLSTVSDASEVDDEMNDFGVVGVSGCSDSSVDWIDDKGTKSQPSFFHDSTSDEERQDDKAEVTMIVEKSEDTIEIAPVVEVECIDSSPDEIIPKKSSNTNEVELDESLSATIVVNEMPEEIIKTFTGTFTSFSSQVDILKKSPFLFLQVN